MQGRNFERKGEQNFPLDGWSRKPSYNFSPCWRLSLIVESQNYRDIKSVTVTQSQHIVTVLFTSSNSHTFNIFVIM